MLATALEKIEQKFTKILQPSAPEPPHHPAPQNNNNEWAILVEGICKKEDAAIEELYHLFSKGVRYYICRQLGSQEVDDKVHDTFLVVIQAIQKGDLREPERLMGFVRTIVRRQIAGSIGRAIQTRRGQTELKEGEFVPDFQKNPEESAISQQNIEIARQALRSISKKDREILIRFYVLEQSQEKICKDMQLSDTQFRLLKSRAKARFGETGKKRITKNPIRILFQKGGSATT